MKTVIFVMSLFLASTAQAAMNQAQCPPDTLWDSSTNQCYLDPNSETARRERREQELREQERKCAEARSAAEKARRNAPWVSFTDLATKGLPLSQAEPRAPMWRRDASWWGKLSRSEERWEKTE